MSILDLPLYQGQRSLSFGFQLVETASGRPLGTVNPRRDREPMMAHDTTRTVKRQLTNVVFPADESAAIDPVQHSLKVSVSTPAGVTYPLGIFVFVDGSRQRFTTRQPLSSTLVDTMLIIDQPLMQSFSVPPGYSVVQAMRDVMAIGVNTLPFVFEGSTAMLGSPFTVPIGSSQAKALISLAQLGGYFDPWVDNSSTLRAIQAFDPAARPYGFDYSAGTQDLHGSIIETSDLLSAPNRFIVIDSGTTGSAVFGSYDVPVSAPHSRINRGFVVPQVSSLTGIGTNVQAIAAATALGQKQTIFERVTLSTPPDPRHDTYDIIRYAGVNWLELGWSMALSEGAPMSHLIRRSYT